MLPRLAPQYNASHIWCEGTLGLASNVSITSGQNSKNAWCILFELELLSLSKLHQYVRKIMNYWTSKSCCHYAKVRLHFAASYTTSWTKRFEYSHTHTHPFNGPLSGTTRVSQYQKGKTNLDFTGARDSEWQWHELGDMQVCTSLQRDNHTNTPPLSFLQAGCPTCRPTNSVKALKATTPINNSTTK